MTSSEDRYVLFTDEPSIAAGDEFEFHGQWFRAVTNAVGHYSAYEVGETIVRIETGMVQDPDNPLPVGAVTAERILDD